MVICPLCKSIAITMGEYLICSNFDCCHAFEIETDKEQESDGEYRSTLEQSE